MRTTLATTGLGRRWTCNSSSTSGNGRLFVTARRCNSQHPVVRASPSRAEGGAEQGAANVRADKAEINEPMPAPKAADPAQPTIAAAEASDVGPATEGQHQAPSESAAPADARSAPGVSPVSGAGPQATPDGTSSSPVPSQQPSGAGAAAVSGGPSGPGGPSAVTLLTRFNGVGYTFVLAGFLKVVTVGGLALSAPTDVARTAFGKATPYLMVPVGVGLCWAAKQIVDTGLNESKRFMQYLVAALVILYFGLVKLMYKYEPQTDWVRRPRPRMPGQMAELRAQLGDRELLAATDMDSSRYYQAERPGSRELYDDVAWYEGRYPSQLAPPGQQQKRGAARRAALAVTDTEEEYSVAVGADAALSRLGSAGTADPAATEVRAPPRRSFLSDNTR